MILAKFISIVSNRNRMLGIGHHVRFLSASQILRTRFF